MQRTFALQHSARKRCAFHIQVVTENTPLKLQLAPQYLLQPDPENPAGRESTFG